MNTLKFKLQGGMAVLLLITLCCCVYGIMGSIRIIKGTEKVVRTTYPALDHASSLVSLVEKTKADIKFAFEELDEGPLEYLESYKTEFESIVRDIIEHDNDLQLIEIQRKYEIYVKNGKNAVLKYIETEDPKFLIRELGNIASVTVKLSDSIKIYKNNKYAEFMASQNTVLDTSQNFSNIFKLVSGVLLIIVFMLMYLSSNMIKDLSLLVTNAIALKAGEMKTEIKVNRSDELGTLQSSFESMRVSLKDYIEHLDAKVQERTERVISLQKQTKDIFDAIDQGILTFNSDFSINSEYSLQTEEIFQTKEIDQLGLKELFVLDDEQFLRFINWVKMLFSHSNAVSSWHNFVKLCPVTQVELNREKDVLIKIEYQPMVVQDKLERIMVVATDITSEHRSKIALEKSEEAQKIILDNVTALMSEDRDDVLTLFDEIEQLVAQHSTVNDLINVNTTELFRVIHTLKGNCGTLKIDHIAILLNEIENLISEYLKTKTMPDANSWAKLFLKMSDYVVDMIKLNENIFGSNDRSLNIPSERLDMVINKMKKMNDLNSKEILSDLNNLKAQPFGVACERYFSQLERVSEKLEVSMNPLNIVTPKLFIQKEMMNVLHMVIPHLINNAVDHGFSKSVSADDSNNQVSLKVEDRGDKLMLAIEDNGVGIQLDRVKEEILEKQLLTLNEINSLNEQEIINYLFESNFTTKSEATVISGRGVGLDAVQATLKDYSGKIVAKSVPNGGTRFECILMMDEYGLPLGDDVS